MERIISARQALYDLLSAYRVNHTIVDSGTADYSFLDFEYRKQLFENYDYTAFFRQIISHADPDQPLEYRDGYGMHYLVFCEPREPHEGLRYHICGPYLYEMPFDLQNPDDFASFASIRQIPKEYHRQVRTFFLRIPIVHDMLVWRTLVTQFLEYYTGHSVSLINAISPDTQRPYKTKLKHSSPGLTLDYESLEARYETERQMLAAITAGDTEKALHYHNKFMGFNLEERGSTPLASAKWYIIAANTAFRKAVEAADVHPLYIDELSGRMTTEIESATSMVQLHHINTMMIRKYCMLVHTYSREQYSPLIKNCLNYIDFNYMDKLSLTFFAQKYSVSKNYLSTLFRNEVSMTITEYINTTRIRHAILLLNSTTMQMQNIAEQCGFEDANYFTRTFKKIQGMTPLKYRQSIGGEKI